MKYSRAFEETYNFYLKNIEVFNFCGTWVNGDPIYHSDIQSQYDLPQWIINAVENQKGKYYT